MSLNKESLEELIEEILAEREEEDFLFEVVEEASATDNQEDLLIIDIEKQMHRDCNDKCSSEEKICKTTELFCNLSNGKLLCMLLEIDNTMTERMVRSDAFIYVLKGTVYIGLNGRDYSAQEGECTIISGESSVCFSSSTSASLLYITSEIV